MVDLATFVGGLDQDQAPLETRQSRPNEENVVLSGGLEEVKAKVEGLEKAVAESVGLMTDAIATASRTASRCEEILDAIRKELATFAKAIPTPYDETELKNWVTEQLTLAAPATEVKEIEPSALTMRLEALEAILLGAETEPAETEQ